MTVPSIAAGYTLKNRCVILAYSTQQTFIGRIPDRQEEFQTALEKEPVIEKKKQKILLAQLIFGPIRAISVKIEGFRKFENEISKF